MLETLSEWLDWRLLTIVALVVWILMRGKFKRMHMKRIERSEAEIEQEERIREALEERKRRRRGE